MNKEFLARRAESMASLFLEDLGPVSLMQVSVNNPMGDFYAGFRAGGGRYITIAVEVKMTEAPVAGEFRFRSTKNIFSALTNSNVPILMLIVDVKNNEFYFNWSTHARIVGQSGNNLMLSLPVKKADANSKKLLLKEILKNGGAG